MKILEFSPKTKGSYSIPFLLSLLHNTGKEEISFQQISAAITKFCKRDMSLSKFIVKRKRLSDPKTHQSDDDLHRKVSKPESSNTTEEKLPKPPLKSDDISETVRTAKVTEEKPLAWRKIKAENLDLDYVQLYSRRKADEIKALLEETVVYNDAESSKVKLFGKWIDIPRKQVEFLVHHGLIEDSIPCSRR